MNELTRRRVREQIEEAMARLILKRTIVEPFREVEVEQKNPFGFRLVPIEVWRGAKFERSFVTTLGQGIFEQLGRIIAEGSGAHAENQHSCSLTLNTFKTETIETIIRNQRATRGRRGQTTTPDLNSEVQQLLGLNNERYEEVVVISDLYVRRNDGREEFYSFKTVKPNIDQTAEAKKNLLLLRSGNPNCEAYFALPYNPAGEGVSYRESGHSIPNKLFNMDDSNFVLIGSDLWNKIGDNPNTFNELLDIFDQVGQSSRAQIHREYFGLR